MRSLEDWTKRLLGGVEDVFFDVFLFGSWKDVSDDFHLQLQEIQPSLSPLQLASFLRF